MKTIRKFFLYVLLLAVTGGCAGLWLLYGSKTSNPYNYATVGDIPVPWGYERIAGDDAAYSSYLRSLPLKGKDVLRWWLFAQGFRTLYGYMQYLNNQSKGGDGLHMLNEINFSEKPVNE